MKKIDLTLDTNSKKIITIKGFIHFNKVVTEEFKTLFRDFFEGIKIPKLSTQFIEVTRKYFSRLSEKSRIKYSEPFFNNINQIPAHMMAQHQYQKAYLYWHNVIQEIILIEDSEKIKLCKAKPYYFASIAAFLSKDIDSGIICINRSLDEEKVNSNDYKKTPAYKFLSLDKGGQDKFLSDFVMPVADFLRDRLDGQGTQKGHYKEYYNGKKGRGRNLIYIDFRLKFFDNPNISGDIKLYFVHSIIRLYHLSTLHRRRVEDLQIAPLILQQTLGGLFIVIEEILEIKYSKDYMLAELFKKLAKDMDWPTPKPKEIKDERDRAFSLWIAKHISGNDLFSDFSMLYGLRNFGFHSIESQMIMWEECTHILQSILNCFFLSVEILNNS